MRMKTVPKAKHFPTRSEAVRDRLYATLNELATENSFVLAVTDEQLKEWYDLQFEWWGKHARKLAATKETPLIAARLAHARETIALLQGAGHILVCRAHGIQGVELPEGLLDVDSLTLIHALADWGIYDGDPAGWKRSCESCCSDAIKAQAAR